MSETKGLLQTGLTLDTWNIRCTFMEQGSMSWTATRFTNLWILKGLINLGASFLDSVRRERSWVDNPNL